MSPWPLAPRSGLEALTRSISRVKCLRDCVSQFVEACDADLKGVHTTVRQPRPQQEAGTEHARDAGGGENHIHTPSARV